MIGRAVPGNRWDLVRDEPHRFPTVSVVIPYYEQPRQLEAVIAALRMQTYPAHLVEVVVADDGSTPPVARTDVTVVRQEDKGFRAAAARNLGAAASTGEVLCFLDSDTVPEPGYLTALTRLPSIVPDALTVGRRLHADLSDVADLGQWLANPPRVDEPGWLADAYRGTGDLLTVDHRSYRWIISAVMCCSREFFDDIGGFDESFVGYGGEDWELANRAFHAGAVVARVPEATAWHDGPDWAGRSADSDERRRAKNGEALSLARLVTDPAARRHGLIFDVPDLVAVIDPAAHSPASLLRTVSSVLSFADCGVWLQGDAAADLLASWGAHDSRIHVGEVPTPVLARTRSRLRVSGRVCFRHGALDALVGLLSEKVGTVTVAGLDVTLRSSRSRRRAARWGTEDLFGAIEVDADEIGIDASTVEPDLSW
ncbi:glycosyltransferase family 2 protein [Actinomycetes bacterium M1A6_2h]